MTAALAAEHPGAVVDTVTVLMRDDGTNRRARLQLRYRQGWLTLRLDFGRDRLANQAEALTTARGRIRDADFADATGSMARLQLVQNAGSAMLSQANAAPQRVLELLR